MAAGLFAVILGFILNVFYDKLGWLGKLDANSLKLKVAASIVAISSIHLLKIFMSMSTNNVTNTKALVFLALHLTFVASACLMVLSDRKSKQVTNAEKDNG